ncbi:metal ABC transporter substrate-binding protein, partial [Thiogranum longum]
FPAPADVDPAFWAPDAETIHQYRQADLVLLNGAAYAKWVEKAALPDSRLVNTSASFADGYIRAESAGMHSYKPGGDAAHTGIAFTTWLDLYQAARQAEAIAQALAGNQPEHKAEFERNLDVLRSELMALDLEFQKLSARQPGKPLFVAQPVYQYFARRYELQLESLAWEPDQFPSDAQWRQLVRAQESFPALWMLWKEQPLTDTAQRLQSLGIEAIIFDPCGNRPQRGDFMTVMKNNLNNLKKVFH